MNNITEVKRCIAHILLYYPDCFDWTAFSDKGTPCYFPDRFSDVKEAYEEATTRAAVLVAMPKGSRSHILLGSKIAELLCCKYVTYDWLVKAVGRLLSGTNYEELKEMTILSTVLRDEMKQKGLCHINSIQEAFA